MAKNVAIDYENYSKQMREALSSQEMRQTDNSLNHQYFHTKKGFYWSVNNQIELVEGLRKYSLNFEKISKEIFKGSKSEIELQLRVCLLFGVKNIRQITKKQIDEFLKTLEVYKNTGKFPDEPKN